MHLWEILKGVKGRIKEAPFALVVLEVGSKRRRVNFYFISAMMEMKNVFFPFTKTQQLKFLIFFLNLSLFFFMK